MLVYNKPCENCLFSKNRIVSKERAAEIIESANKSETHFVCHKSSMAKVGTKDICCNRFYTKFKNTNEKLKFLTKIKAIHFVNFKSKIIK